jgi:hypothetical protein
MAVDSKVFGEVCLIGHGRSVRRVDTGHGDSSWSWENQPTPQLPTLLGPARTTMRLRAGADAHDQKTDRARVYISSTLEGMASQDTTTVRVRRPDSERLQSLAKTRKTTVIDVLHEAIDALERQEFLRGLNDDYRHLREDPARWQAFIEERQEWDSIG